MHKSQNSQEVLLNLPPVKMTILLGLQVPLAVVGGLHSLESRWQLVSSKDVHSNLHMTIISTRFCSVRRWKGVVEVLATHLQTADYPAAGDGERCSSVILEKVRVASNKSQQQSQQCVIIYVRQGEGTGTTPPFKLAGRVRRAHRNSGTTVRRGHNSALGYCLSAFS
jgi:hypothetical protein